jgi:hypothetical protein
LSTKELLQTANVNIQGINKNNVKMNSDKLKRLRKIWWERGEDYPLKTCIMEWVIWVFYEGIDGMEFGRECFGM